MIYTKLKKKIAVAGAVVIAMSSAVVTPSVKNTSQVGMSVTAANVCTPLPSHYHYIYTTTSTKSKIKYYISDSQASGCYGKKKFYANGDYWISVSGKGFMRSVDFNSMINHYYNKEKATTTIPADVINAIK